MAYLWTGVHALGSAPVLKGLGITNSLDAIAITVQANDAKRSVALITVPSGPRPKLVAPRNVAAPLFLRDVAQPHRELALPEHDALYVQLNQMVNDKDETLPAFAIRLRGVLAKTGANHVILDVRHNNGGSDTSITELLRTLTAFSVSPGNQLYVIIGRGVYSATATLITELERLADPIFVGEASSECCNFYGYPSGVVLPYSGFEGELTRIKAAGPGNPWDARVEMSPEVPVQLTAAAYFAGRDPALETILKMIRK